MNWIMVTYNLLMGSFDKKENTILFILPLGKLSATHDLRDYKTESF